VAIRFLEPAGDKVAPPALRAWKEIHDADRIAALRGLADNPPARFALTLFRIAWDLAPPDGVAAPTLFIGVEPGGNYARLGFELVGDDGARTRYPALPYLILEQDARTFRDTLLHETGHAFHALVSHRDDGEDGSVAPIPHSTAAITDQRTAFNEGLAIHLETVNAHCSADPETRGFYQRRGATYGAGNGLRAQYYAAARDLASYAQNLARYDLVRDGLYSFEPAVSVDERDYLRIQLTPARDRRSLRPASALVASEGFVAAVLFHTLASDCSDLDGLLPRYRSLIAALARSEGVPAAGTGIPLIDLVAALVEVDRPLGERAVRAFLDLSHGVTVDGDAAALWARFHDAALHLDMASLMATRAEIEKRREGWEGEALADPRILARRVGPVVVLRAPAVVVGLTAFGPPQPLDFDVNAAGPAILRLVPGLREPAVAGLLAERDKAPFASTEEFFARVKRLRLPAGALIPRPR